MRLNNLPGDVQSLPGAGGRSDSTATSADGRTGPGEFAETRPVLSRGNRAWPSILAPSARRGRGRRPVAGGCIVPSMMWMLLAASIVVACVVWLAVAIIAAPLLVGGWLDRRDARLGRDLAEDKRHELVGNRPQARQTL